jgi:hypothetical protein
MSDETGFPTDPEPEAETPEVEVPDPKAAALAAKEEQLRDWEKKLNARSSELGAMAKAVESVKPAPAPDDAPELDPESQKALDAYLKRTLGIDPKALASTVAMQQAQLAEEVETTTNEWFKSHKDVTPEQVGEVVVALGIDTSHMTARKAKQVLDYVAKIIKADPSPEEFEAKVQEAAEAKLAEMKKSGEEIVDVRKKGAVDPHSKKSLESIAEHGTPDEVFAALSGS